MDPTLAPLPSAREPELEEIARDLVVLPGVAPGAVLGLGVRVESAWRMGVGAAGTRSAADGRTLDENAIFDLASVTKPFVASAAVRLARRHVISLDAPLASLLDELETTPSAQATLSLLLAHRAGLEAHRTLYAPLIAARPFDRRSALLEAARARRDDCTGPPPDSGFTPVYSDLGYLLAGAALERAVAAPLDALIEREIARPLAIEVGSARQWFARASDFAARAVPTELVPWRGGLLAATVHDENSWAIAGHGVAGAAGLFGSAADVARFGCAMLDALSKREQRWIDAEAANWLVAARPGGSLRAGFDGKAGVSSLAGERCGPRTFGHLGFTGTSLWCDPDAECVFVVLTNRVTPTRDNVKIRAARPRVNDAMMTVAERWRLPG
jgi:serine-type D-Ala-D-Ala carboxypeptidase